MQQRLSDHQTTLYSNIRAPARHFPRYGICSHLSNSTTFWQSILIFFLYSLVSQAFPASLLAIYQEAPTPYQEAFKQMLDGIAHTSNMPVFQKKITTTTSQEEFQGWLTEGRDKDVVLLGLKALNFYEQSGQNQSNIFLTGVNALPGQVPLPGISLAIDPMLYLRTLRELLPNIQHVVAYYNIQEEPWAALVRKAAQNVHLDIETIGVTDAFDLARQLAKTFKTLDPRTTALWFSGNTIQLNDELIYSYVLEQTWDRGIAVFSDMIVHVKRGFLFAIYPDYTEIGHELGTLIQQRAQITGLQFSHTSRLAFNLRTARHLGLTVSDNLIQRAYPLYSDP